MSFIHHQENITKLTPNLSEIKYVPHLWYTIPRQKEIEMTNHRKIPSVVQKKELQSMKLR